MNPKQLAALAHLIARLVAERGVTEEMITSQVLDSKVLVTISHPTVQFPTVSIGKQGGYGMPTISSYPENGVVTALDAAVYGDWHLRKQNGKRGAAGNLPYGPNATGYRVPEVAQPTENTEVNAESEVTSA